MSFRLLKEKIIDPGLCIKCGVCARSCIHIELDENKTPYMAGKCILDKNGLKCGYCYSRCPTVRKQKLLNLDPREHILELIKENSPIDLKTLIEKQTIGLTGSKVRYEALRLVQLNEVKMKVDEELRYPVFYIE